MIWTVSSTTWAANAKQQFYSNILSIQSSKHLSNVGFLRDQYWAQESFSYTAYINDKQEFIPEYIIIVFAVNATIATKNTQEKLGDWPIH